jgi:hypothetical protein
VRFDAGEHDGTSAQRLEASHELGLVAAPEGDLLHDLAGGGPGLVQESPERRDRGPEALGVLLRHDARDAEHREALEQDAEGPEELFGLVNVRVEPLLDVHEHEGGVGGYESHRRDDASAGGSVSTAGPPVRGSGCALQSRSP